MQIRFLSCQLILLISLLSVISASAGDGGPLHLEKEILLPGVRGRIDHFSADVPGRRLFIAAIENGSVEIVDARQGTRTAEITGLKEPQGVYYDAKRGRLYVATGGDGKLRVYDGNSLTLEQSFDFGGDADNVRYDQRTGDVWVGFGNGGIGVVDAAGQKVGSVELGSHPESFQFEDSGGLVYANVPEQFGVTVIDRKKREVVAKWGLGLSLANYPMALDHVDKRLFVGCRLPARLIVMDTVSGRVITSVATVGDTDDVFFDTQRRLVYVVGGEGAVDVLRQKDPNDYERVGRTATAPGARTGLFVPDFNRLYVAVPHRESQTAKVLEYQMTASASTSKNGS